MPDWNALVRAYLGMSESSVEDVAAVAELSSHLEDAYEELLEAGLSEPEAIKQALGHRANWRTRQENSPREEQGGSYEPSNKNLVVARPREPDGVHDLADALAAVWPAATHAMVARGAPADALSGVASYPAFVWGDGRLHVASRGRRTVDRTHRQFVSLDCDARIMVSGGSDKRAGREESACLAAVAPGLVRCI